MSFTPETEEYIKGLIKEAVTEALEEQADGKECDAEEEEEAPKQKRAAKKAAKKTAKKKKKKKAVTEETEEEEAGDFEDEDVPEDYKGLMVRIKDMVNTLEDKEGARTAVLKWLKKEYSVENFRKVKTEDYADVLSGVGDVVDSLE